MNYTSATQGRVFVLRLEDGDVVHESIEAFAREAGVGRAVCFAVGGAGGRSRIVVGPEDGAAATIVPMELALGDVHEMAAVGTIFPDESGAPVLHMHAVFGRGAAARSGCVRAGVTTWLVGEVVVIELVDCTATRRRDPGSGFALLSIDA